MSEIVTLKLREIPALYPVWTRLPEWYLVNISNSK